jgi:hypothetical protein
MLDGPGATSTVPGPRTRARKYSVDGPILDFRGFALRRELIRAEYRAQASVPTTTPQAAVGPRPRTLLCPGRRSASLAWLLRIGLGMLRRVDFNAGEGPSGLGADDRIELGSEDERGRGDVEIGH